MLDEKDLQAIDQLIAHRMNIIIESEVTPKFDLLAEGQEAILDRLNREVASLKKANRTPRPT